MNGRYSGRPRLLPLARALVAAALLGPFLGGCLMYMADEFVPTKETGEHAVAEPTAASQITLAWDPPAGAIEKYRVYFRIHGTADWVQLAEIPAAPAPEYTVLHSALGSGEFDFGVVAVQSGNQSSLHSSLDATANPTAGWYLKWQ